MAEQAKKTVLSVTQLATGFWVSQALYVAAKLGVADLLNDAPKTSFVLAEAAGVHPQALYRLLRALASVGVFAEDELGRFSNTSLSDCIRTTSGSLRPFVIMQGEQESWLPWGRLLHSVTTGAPAFEHVFGKPQFVYLAEHPEAARVFDEAMTSRSAAEIEDVLRSYDFSGSSSFVDIGGGQGALLRAILNARPDAKGVLFDLPHVIERARCSLSEHSWSQRCQLEAGDFFEAVPGGFDVYLLKKIIHDWDDEQAIRILKNCRKAMAPHARLLLIELVVPTGNDPSFAKLLDLLMMIWPGGRERTGAEYRQILESADLRLMRIVPTQGLVSVIEAVSR
jgi:hypothetical protein